MTFDSRPVEARPSREEGCIYVVTDVRSAKEYEIERDPTSELQLSLTNKQTLTLRLPRMALIFDQLQSKSIGGDQPTASGGKDRRSECMRSASRANIRVTLGRSIVESRRAV